jgi:hypothetical protein
MGRGKIQDIDYRFGGAGCLLRCCAKNQNFLVNVKVLA